MFYFILFSMITNVAVHANNGAISGVVYEDVYPYKSISSLFVVCYNFYSGKYVAMGVTQEDGTYHIELPSGEYTVYAQPEDESVYIPEFYENTFDSFYAKKVTVSAGHTVVNIDFGLTIGGVISGNVLHATEETPISFVRIEAYDEVGDLQGYTRSLDDGRYFLHVPEGKYKLRAFETENRNYVTVFYKETPNAFGTFDFREADTIEVEKGYGTGYFNFFLLQGIKVEGIVTGINHAPVPNVIVWAWATSGNYQLWAKTLSDGSFEISVPEASYWFYAESSTYLSQYYQHAYDVVNATIVTVNQHMDGINFQLETENSIKYKLEDVITMLQLLSGFSIDQTLSISYYDQNSNNHVDMVDVLQTMHILKK